MHIPLKVVFRLTEDGLLFVDFFVDGADDTISINTEHLQQQDLAYDVLLSTPEIKPGRTPPDKRIKKRARREEELIAEEVGGKRQKGSGALPWAKGDVRKKGHLRIEVKTCKVKQYTVTRNELNKIRGECGLNEKPAFVITFIHPQTLRQEDKWVLIPYEDWNEANVNRRPSTS